ncbi:MAG: hypothetical protein LAP85_27865 [Acidobacteriia bacterium]|nr:hypothetical protein [Terriglobia bacterium]
MGEVYRAEDTNLDRQVAIKVLPDTYSGDPERPARFEREAKLLASLNHPNIAAIHGLEELPAFGREVASGRCRSLFHLSVRRICMTKTKPSKSLTPPSQPAGRKG